MKHKYILFIIWSTMIVLSLLSVGCSPKIINSNDLHQLQIGSPLSGLNPKIFAIKEFVDVRGTPPQLVGKGQGMGGDGLNIDKPVATVITTAIIKEFERNGHKVLFYPTQSKTDFTINGTIYKFSFINRIGYIENEGIANVAIKLTATSTHDSNKVLVRKYEGEDSYDRSIFRPIKTYTEILNQALLNMIRDMSMDQELLKFLNN